MRTISIRSWVQVCVFAALCLLLPTVVADQYYMSIAVLTMLVIGLCVSWNIAGGFAGMFSFAHTIFIALGAILPALLAIHHGISPWLSMLVAALVSAVAGAAFAWMGNKFQLNVLTFALVTLGFAELTLVMVTGTRSLGGSAGLSIPGQLSIGGLVFDTPSKTYYLVMVCVLVVLIVSVAIRASKFGFYLIALRDNVSAARGIGIPVLKYSAYSMAVSAAFTALFGGLYTQYFLYMDPYRVASPIFMIEIVLFTTLGGLGTIWGPVIGAAVFLPLGEILRAQVGSSVPGLPEILTGFAVILVVSFARTGLVGLLGSLIGSISRLPARRREASGESMTANLDPPERALFPRIEPNSGKE